MKSLSFTFHAFLHGVQGPYCAWHPLQVLVGFVQTFSTFSNLKKKRVFLSWLWKRWVTEWCGSWATGLGGRACGVGAQRREKTDKVKQVENVAGVYLCHQESWAYLWQKFQEAISVSVSATVATRPSPLLLFWCTSVVIVTVYMYTLYLRKAVALLSIGRLGHLVPTKKKIRQFCTFVF